MQKQTSPSRHSDSHMPVNIMTINIFTRISKGQELSFYLHKLRKQYTVFLPQLLDSIYIVNTQDMKETILMETNKQNEQLRLSEIFTC